MIRIENLNKRFKKLHALQQINADFEKGQVLALIGPNGSGKTTLIKSILGLVKPDSGRILINGEPIDRNPAYRSQIGYMPQIGRYPDNMKVGRVFQMLEDVRSDYGQQPDTELLEAFHLQNIFHKTMRTLSGGTRQKVSAALAFYFNPDILILDEPTAGLDPLSAELLKEKVMREKKKNKLVLITSHVLSDLDDMITHVLYLQDGRLQFLRSLTELRSDTGEERISRIIASIMLQYAGGDPSRQWLVNSEGKISIKS